MSGMRSENSGELCLLCWCQESKGDLHAGLFRGSDAGGKWIDKV